jgi:hypothetical protein
MDEQTTSFVWVALDIIAAALIALFAVALVGTARTAEISHERAEMRVAATTELREWEQYFGTVTGADVIDFVARHKYDCDIVIRGADFGADARTRLADDAVVLGLQERYDMPDYAWDADYIFYEILGGDGESTFTASPMYDGALSPGSVGEAITGVCYTLK